MRLFDLFRSHLLDHLFLTDRRIGISSDRGKNVPHISPDEIGRGHSKTKFIVPSDARLRAGVSFHGASQIPFKSPDIVLFDAQPKSVHHADEFLGVCVSGPRRRKERLHGFLKFSGLHQVSGFFDIGKRGNGKKPYQYPKSTHSLLLAFLLAGPAMAVELPRPLSDDDFIAFDAQKAKIGQLLFYDKILSGNRNISCATCHSVDFGGGDGLSLGIGEGGQGIGPDRTPGEGPDRVVKRIPRNSPGLWNLGARDISILFHDGRVSVSDLYGNGFNTPAEEWLPDGLDNILAAQALFPLTSPAEMAGQPEENQISGAVNDRIDGGWPIIAKRVRTIPQYGEMFVDAFDNIDTPQDITIAEIANAIAAFVGTEWRNYDSPFDAYLNGDGSALNATEVRGMNLFFGEANCATCHSGSLFSDQEFYALALPAFGPGRTRKFDLIARDMGRIGETDVLEDAYRFRTPMLRNVELTAPYGHNGAFPTLEAMIAHHADPIASLGTWRKEDAALPEIPWLAEADFIIQQDRREMARQAARIDIQNVELSSQDIADIANFLRALTGETAQTRPMGRPDAVPSGLSID